MATVSVNSNYAADVTLVANDETVTVNSGAILTVDSDSLNSGFKPGYFLCTTSGEIHFTNSSTTVPIIIDLWDQNADLLLQKGGVLRITGDWITVHTGTGAASQTINFTSIGGKSIDTPGFIEVETSSGSNEYERWAIFFKSSGGSYEHSLTDYGIGELGNICEFDIGTQIMTFGDGTNGNVVPSGAKVRFPNIHITSSGSYVTSYNGGNLVWLTNGGTFIADTVSFSRKWSGSFKQIGKIDMRNMGWSRYLYAYDCAGPMKLENVCFNPDTHNFANAGLYIQYFEGFLEMDKVTTYNMQTGTGNRILSAPNTAETFDDIQCFYKGRTSAASNALDWDNCGVKTVTNLLVVGARGLLSNMSDFEIETLRFSDQPDGVKSTSISMIPFAWENVKNVVVRDFEYSANGCPQYNSLFLYDANCANIIVHNFDLDGDSHATYLCEPRGGLHVFANGTYRGDRVTYNLNVAAKMGGLIMRNVLATNTDTTQPVSNNMYLENYESNATSDTLTNKFTPHPFHVLQGSANGWLQIGQFGNGYDGDSELFEITSGTWGTDIRSDDNGVLYLEGNGVYAVFKNKFPIRSITAFAATVPLKVEGSTSGRTYEFRMKEAGSQAANWTAWRDATVGTNYQDAITDMTDYDSGVGMDMEFKVETTSALTRYLRYIKVYATVDAAWTPDPIYSRVRFSGATENAWCYVEDIRVPATPVKYPPVQADVNGDARIFVPHPADGTLVPIRIRVRHVDDTIPQSWIPIDQELDLPFSGIDVPVKLIEANDITGAAVFDRGDGLQDALITIDAPNKRIRFGNDKIRLENLYDYMASWQASFEGIQFERALGFNGADGTLFNDWRIMRDNVAHTEAAIDGYINVDGDPNASPDDEINDSVDIQAKVVRTIDGVSQADITSIKAVTDKLADMIIGSTPDFQFDAKALELGGGDQQIAVTPIGSPIVDLSNTQSFTFGFLVTDPSGNAVDPLFLTAGTVSVLRKPEGLAGVFTPTVISAACSKSVGLISYSIVFDSVTYAEGDSIQLLFKDQEATLDSGIQQITGGLDKPFFTTIKKTAVAVTGTVDANVVSVDGTGVTGPNDLKADLTPVITGQANIQTDISNLNDISVADVWDENLAGHLIAGSTGEKLNDTSEFDSTTDNVALTPASRAAIVDETWDEALSAHLAIGSTGEALNNAQAPITGTVNANIVSVNGGATTSIADFYTDLSPVVTIVTDNKKLLRADSYLDHQFAILYEEGTANVLLQKNVTGVAGPLTPVELKL